jgi:hypothetical protein
MKTLAGIVALFIATAVVALVAQKPHTLAVQVVGVEERSRLSLRLPDGNVVVVRCATKIDWTNLGESDRSCRVPSSSVGLITAEFSGSKATLSWKVPSSGKMISETYSIMATRKLASR